MVSGATTFRLAGGKISTRSANVFKMWMDLWSPLSERMVSTGKCKNLIDWFLRFLVYFLRPCFFPKFHFLPKKHIKDDNNSSSSLSYSSIIFPVFYNKDGSSSMVTSPWEGQWLCFDFIFIVSFSSSCFSNFLVAKQNCSIAFLTKIFLLLLCQTSYVVPVVLLLFLAYVPSFFFCVTSVYTSSSSS